MPQVDSRLSFRSAELTAEAAKGAFFRPGAPGKDDSGIVGNQSARMVEQVRTRSWPVRATGLHWDTDSRGDFGWPTGHREARDYA
jgi:hypothetical protein